MLYIIILIPPAKVNTYFEYLHIIMHKSKKETATFLRRSLFLLIILVYSLKLIQ